MTPDLWMVVSVRRDVYMSDGIAGRAGDAKRGAPVAEVRAEMVANVWKVVAAEGDQVQDGDTLVILESMKMEIPVIVEDSGTVAQLRVAEGDVVQEGDLIAVIE
jgi:acetyl-CoA carboxylase biotin carboxyl carrier protein